MAVKKANGIDYEKLAQLVDDSGFTRAQIGQVLGMSPKWLSQGIRMQNLSDEKIPQLVALLRVSREDITLTPELPETETAPEPDRGGL